jgi:hypothetical protein
MKQLGNKLLIIILIIGVVYRISLTLLAPPTVIVDDSGGISNSEPLANPFKMPLFYSALSVLPEQHILTLVLGVLTLPLLYLVCKEFFSERVSLYATLFLAFLPKHAYMGAVNTPIIATTFFGMLALYLMVLAQRKGFPALLLLGSGASAALGFLMDFPGIVVPGILFFYVLLQKEVPLKKRAKVLVIFLIPTILAVIWYVVTMLPLFGPMLAHTGTNEYFTQPYSPPEQALRFGAYSYFDFWWHARGFDTEAQVLSFIGSVTGVVPVFVWALTVWIVGTVVLSMMILVGIRLCRREWREDKHLLLLLWLGLYLLFWVAIMLLGGGIMTRHIHPIMIAVSVFFGIGMAKKDKKIVRILVVLSFLVVMGTSLVHAVYLHERVDAFYGPATEWIEDNVAQDDLLLVVEPPYPWEVTTRYNAVFATMEYIEKGAYNEADYIYVSSYKVGQDISERGDIANALLDALNESGRFEQVFYYKSKGFFSRDVWVRIYKNNG